MSQCGSHAGLPALCMSNKDELGFEFAGELKLSAAAMIPRMIPCSLMLSLSVSSLSLSASTFVSSLSLSVAVESCGCVAAVAGAAQIPQQQQEARC